MKEIDSILEHHGVKGMKWGIRKRGINIGKIYRKPTAKAPSSEDFKKAQVARSKVSKGSTHALTNDELQSLVKRMNLEQSFSRLSAKPSKFSKGQSAVKSILDTAGTVNSAVALANSPAAKAVRTAMNKK